jgi:hypothetical protein
MFVLPSKGAAQLKFSRNPLASFLGTDALFHKVQSVNRKIQQATQNQKFEEQKQPKHYRHTNKTTSTPLLKIG